VASAQNEQSAGWVNVERASAELFDGSLNATEQSAALRFKQTVAGRQFGSDLHKLQK
jgi:hypothetical protein